MQKVQWKPDIFRLGVDADLRDGNDREVDKHEPDPVKEHHLPTLEEKVELLVIDELALLIVIIQHQVEGQYDKTGDDHVIERLEVLDLEH